MANLKNLKVSRISYDAIREKAAAVSGSLSTTAFANAGATAEAAPYLPKVVSAGEQDLDAQCQAFSAKTEYTYEQARYFWNALMECVAEVLNDGVHTSVEFGYWRFALEVAGSVPSANSAPSAVDNPVWIAVYPSAELQSVAASIETMPNLASQPFQIKEVFGADHVPNRVKAGTQMLVMGVGLTMGGEGEKVEIARGASVTECTYVPREGDLNTRIRATVPSTVPAGKGYSLLVTARGKHGEEPTTLSKGNIEIVAADLPPPTPIYTSTLGGTKVYTGVDDHEHDLPSGPVAVMATTDRLTLTGQLQATSETAPTTGITHVFIQDVTGDNIECPFAFGPTGTMKLNVGAALAEVPAGTYANAKFTFFCYTNGEQDGLTIPVVIEKS